MTDDFPDWRQEMLERFDRALHTSCRQVPDGPPTWECRALRAPGLPYSAGGLGLTLAEQLPLAGRLGAALRPEVLDRWAALELLWAIDPVAARVTADVAGGADLAIHPQPAALGRPAGSAVRLNGTLPSLPAPAADAVLAWLTHLDLIVLVPTRGDGIHRVMRSVLGRARYDLRLDDVTLGAEHVICRQPDALWTATLATARLRLAAYLNGLAGEALRAAHRHARQRHQFGRPIAEFQAVTAPLAALAIRARGSHLLTTRTGERADMTTAAGQRRAAQALAAAADSALASARQAVHVHGATGLVAGSPPASRYQHAVLDRHRLGPPGPPSPHHGPPPGDRLVPAPGRPDLAQLGRRVPRRWTCHPQQYDIDIPVHKLVEKQAASTPTAVAVAFGDYEMTYGQLEEKAGRLAAALIRRGIGRGDLVGIFLTRSPDLVVAVLAVLKAGAAYLPLDPDYPSERLAHMLSDSSTQLVVCHQWMANLLPAGPALLFPDGPVPPRPGPDHPGEAPEVNGSAESGDLAYVLYTSGSTGTPKGVLVEHRGVANRILWDGQRFPLGPGDTVLQHTSLNFDISVWEIFAPLASGARLAIAPPGATADPDRLLQLVDDHAVTVLALVPSMLEMLLDHPSGLSGRTSLRWLFCGGEVLPLSLCRRVWTQLAVEIHNFYGPTEATVDATHWAVNPAEQGMTAPIGTPIGNAESYVLDERLCPVPVGLPGELYVGGPGVARGYLNRPELNAHRFVSNPFGPSARLYRTGDLARYREDGVVEFLGRIDDQVKVRGHRVELGEIEASLADDPDVQQAVAVPATENLALHVFVLPAPGARPDFVALRDRLLRRLPAAILPNGITLVDNIPKTPSGKVDRTALAARIAERPPSAITAGQGISSGAEQVLSLMRSILNAPDFELDDDFFARGGNSLLASRLIATCRRELGRPVELASFIAEPTARTLLRLLGDR